MDIQNNNDSKLIKRTIDIIVPKCDLTTEQKFYKPFRYPWAYEVWAAQQRVHWIPEEVSLAEDVKDWNKINDSERNLITQIFRFFTQSDIEVNSAYTNYYPQIFKPIEILMMLCSFSNIETVHIAAYSYLLDTIGMPEVEYSAFLKFKEMKDKHDYINKFSIATPEDIAKTLAVYGAFTEGLQLFSSFAILLNFPRFNKLKGMGQIVSWSVRDETLHCKSIIKLFREYISQNYYLWTKELQDELRSICNEIVKHEDAFIDLAFEMGPVKGLTAQEVKGYIRYVANLRLSMLGLEPLYSDYMTNPLPWLAEMLNAIEHTNFFENRATEYSKGDTSGEWSNLKWQ